MERSNLLFLIALIIGVGVAYFAVNQAYSEGSAVFRSSCVDSDDGLDYGSYGYVTYRNANYYDDCSGTTLIERYCLNNRPTSQRYRCATNCYNGQCGSSPCVNECQVSGVKECMITTVGAAYRICGNYDADSCLEWASPTYCPAGYTCQNGLCSRK